MITRTDRCNSEIFIPPHCPQYVKQFFLKAQHYSAKIGRSVLDRENILHKNGVSTPLSLSTIKKWKEEKVDKLS